MELFAAIGLFCLFIVVCAILSDSLETNEKTKAPSKEEVKEAYKTIRKYNELKLLERLENKYYK